MNKKAYDKEEMRRKVLKNAQENVKRETAAKMRKKFMQEETIPFADPASMAIMGSIQQGKKLVKSIKSRLKK